MRFETEILEVEFLKMRLPFSREDTGTAELFKRYVEPSKASKQVYELEASLHRYPQTPLRTPGSLQQSVMALPVWAYRPSAIFDDASRRRSRATFRTRLKCRIPKPEAPGRTATSRR